MSFNLKMEGIIQHNIFTERNIMDWDEYKNNITKLNYNNGNNCIYNDIITTILYIKIY